MWDHVEPGIGSFLVAPAGRGGRRGAADGETSDDTTWPMGESEEVMSPGARCG